MCKVSIIVPVYNVEDYLEKCINSLVKQKCFQDMEVILIDDGSKDNSGKICDCFAEEYKNIVCIHQENKGVSAARNAGIEHAKGEYIGFTDADDYVESWYYEEMYCSAKKHRADLVVYDYFVEFSDSNQLKQYRKKKSEYQYDKSQAMPSFLSGVNIGINLFDKLFIRNKMHNIKFHEEIKIGEDLYFIFEFLKNVDCVYGKSKAGYHYLQRSGSAMNGKFSEKYFDVIKVSEWILKEIEKNFPKYLPQAEALYIHSAYKTLERVYKFSGQEQYQKRIDELKQDIHYYSCVKAWKFLSHKQFAGFLLMKYSPKLYLMACKIKKI